MSFFRVIQPDQKYYEKLKAKWHTLPPKNTLIFIDLSTRGEIETTFSIENLVSNNYSIQNNQIGYFKSPIGSGYYGSVSVYHTLDGSEIVIKAINYKKTLPPEMLEEVIKRTKEECKNIQLSERQIETIKFQYERTKETQFLKEITLETEINFIIYGEGSLYIDKEKKIAYLKLKKLPPCVKKDYLSKTLPEFLKFYIELLKATQFLHEKDIVHGDIHPGNMCRDEKTGKIFLCDFGFARKIGSLTARAFKKIQYAPELKNQKSIPADPSQDVYTLGYELSKFKNLNKELTELSLEMMQIASKKRPSVLDAIKRCEKILLQISKKGYVATLPGEKEETPRPLLQATLKRNESHLKLFKPGCSSEDSQHDKGERQSFSTYSC